MRAVAGPLVANALLVFAGLGVLRGLGVLGLSRRAVLAAVGMAYFAGLAAVMLVVIALLVCGTPFTAVTVGAVSVVVGISGLLLGRRRSPPDPERPAWTRADRLVAAGGALAFTAYALAGSLSAIVTSMGAWDSWSLWTRKAIVIAHDDGLALDYFGSHAYGSTHTDYPILLPLLEATWFSAADTVDLEAIHLQFWILLVFFVWAVADRISRVTRPLVWVPILLAGAVCPGLYQHLLSAYADVPMGFFVGLGVLLLGLWLAERRAADLALCALFLAGAASTKNEGLLVAAVALACALVVCAARRDLAGSARVVAAGAGVLVAVLPWRIWLAIHDIEGDLPLSSGVDPGYLFDRTERLRPSLAALHHELAEEPRWFLLVPLAAGLCLASLIWRARRGLPAFYLLTGAALFASFLWVYWLSPYDVTWHLDTSVDRVVASLFFVALAALLHIAAVVERELPAGALSGWRRRRTRS